MQRQIASTHTDVPQRRAAFTLVELPSLHGENGEAAEVHGEEFHLGTFELPLPAGYEQLH